jgi:hypothetical protein
LKFGSMLNSLCPPFPPYNVVQSLKEYGKHEQGIPIT